MSAPTPAKDVIHWSDDQLLQQAWTQMVAGQPPTEFKAMVEWYRVRMHLLERIHSGPNYKLTARQLASLPQEGDE